MPGYIIARRFTGGVPPVRPCRLLTFYRLAPRPPVKYTTRVYAVCRAARPWMRLAAAGNGLRRR